MTGKPFADTNVLIDAIASQGSDATKATKAKALLQPEDLCLSTQVLGEFYQA